jgi:hypothetical protein
VPVVATAHPLAPAGFPGNQSSSIPSSAGLRAATEGRQAAERRTVQLEGSLRLPNSAPSRLRRAPLRRAGRSQRYGLRWTPRSLPTRVRPRVPAGGARLVRSASSRVTLRQGNPTGAQLNWARPQDQHGGRVSLTVAAKGADRAGARRRHPLAAARRLPRAGAHDVAAARRRRGHRPAARGRAASQQRRPGQPLPSASPQPPATLPHPTGRAGQAAHRAGYGRLVPTAQPGRGTAEGARFGAAAASGSSLA